jgi:hypothetical protein
MSHPVILSTASAEKVSSHPALRAAIAQTMLTGRNGQANDATIVSLSRQSVTGMHSGMGSSQRGKSALTSPTSVFYISLGKISELVNLPRPPLPKKTLSPISIRCPFDTYTVLRPFRDHQPFRSVRRPRRAPRSHKQSVGPRNNSEQTHGSKRKSWSPPARTQKETLGNMGEYIYHWDEDGYRSVWTRGNPRN